MIKNADYVLSASFHGTAFSIKFEKQFYVVRGKHNGKVNMDDRMSSLLKLCGLDSRQLIEGEAWTIRPSIIVLPMKNWGVKSNAPEHTCVMR